MPVVYTRTENAARYGNRLVAHLSEIGRGERKVSEHLTYAEMMKDNDATGIPIGIGNDLERLLEALEGAKLPVGLTLFVVPKRGTLGDLLDVEGFTKRGINMATLTTFRRETLDHNWSGVTFAKAVES